MLLLFSLGAQKVLKGRRWVSVDDYISVRASSGCAINVSSGAAFVRNIGSRSVYKSTFLTHTLSHLSSLPCVENVHVYNLHSRSLRLACSDPYIVYQSSIEQASIPLAWELGTNGSGVNIVVVDDGVTNHEDYVVSSRFRQGDTLSAGQHGTSVSGVACASSNGLGMCGAAFAARLVDVDLLSRKDALSDVSEAMAFDEEHMHWESVYVNSWGPTDDGRCEGPGEELVSVLEKGLSEGRRGLGAIYVFASGNGGPDENMNDDGYANHPGTIAVTAVNGESVAYFSEWGAAITVSASGYQVLATARNHGYTYFYGTSAAAPIVAGAVALMLHSNPTLGWRDVQEILMLSARRTLAQEGWILNSANRSYHYLYGAGIVDAARSVRLSRRWSNLPPPYSVTLSLSSSSRMPSLALFSVQAPLRVEHVRVCASMRGPASSIEAWVESPHKTRAVLTRPTVRSSPVSPCSYAPEWCFTSLVQWGESAVGRWSFFATSHSSVEAWVDSVRITLHGSRLENNVVGCA